MFQIPIFAHSDWLLSSGYPVLVYTKPVNSVFAQFDWLLQLGISKQLFTEVEVN